MGNGAMPFKRYAIYYTPGGALSRFGAGWLGWNPLTGEDEPHPDVAGLPAPVAEITETPRKYGIHATIKPPFRLAKGVSEAALRSAAEAFCATQAPVRLQGLEMRQLGRFLALVPEIDSADLDQMAADAVRALDPFRAPLTDEDIAKRRGNGLTEQQDTLLLQWGYPYVMEEFRFHITLTGKLPKVQVGQVAEVLTPIVTPLLPRPFVIDALSLLGEGEDGRFYLIQRYALSGSN